MSTFFYRGEGGFRKYLYRHLNSLFFSKVRILKKIHCIANEYFFPREIIFFNFFPFISYLLEQSKSFFAWRGGEGPSNVYVVFMGGLPNVYVYLQGGRRDQKWLKSCLRSKSMPPIYKIYYT